MIFRFYPSDLSSKYLTGFDQISTSFSLFPLLPANDFKVGGNFIGFLTNLNKKREYFLWTVFMGHLVVEVRFQPELFDLPVLFQLAMRSGV